MPSSTSPLHPLLHLDTQLSLWLHQTSLPIPRSLLKALEISGDGRFWFPIPISLLYFSPRSPILLGLITGSLLDLLLIGLIKHLVRRPRPLYNKGMNLTFAVDHWSFPSGHSSRVFFIASFISFSAAVEVRGWDGFVVFVCVWGWAAATSASRVLLGRHFVLDVVAGACLGVFEALFVLCVMKFYGLFGAASAFLL